MTLPECETEKAWIGVWKDGTLLRKFPVENGCRRYEICTEDEGKGGCLRILKLTEEQYGLVGIASVGMELEPEDQKRSDRRLLFIGDSISAGYGVEGQDGELFSTESENVTMAYPWMTAQALHADVHIFAVSGSGLLSRWIPPEEDEPLQDELLSELIPYGAYYLEKSKGTGYRSMWDPAVYRPDAVVVNLGTNDASYTKGKKEREHAFEEAYVQFIRQIAGDYPDTPIVCVYGLMENTLMDCEKAAVGRCQSEGISVTFEELPLQDPKRDGISLAGHPSVQTQRKVADRLIEILRKFSEDK
jgi:lysophospholipase L1-like esterase